MYFTNFVSTSLTPIIYSGQFGQATPNIENNAVNLTNSSLDDMLQSNMYSDTDKQAAAEGYSALLSPHLGMVIRGADKLNVIIPGTISSYPDECEVILPRGVAMKMTNLYAPSADSDETQQCLGEFDIIPPEQLDESMEFIDGDKFLNEGVIEEIDPPVGFKSLFNKVVKRRDNSVEAKTLLSTMVNFTGVSNKFID